MGRLRDKRRATFTATATKRGWSMKYDPRGKYWILARGDIRWTIASTEFEVFSVLFMIRFYLS